MIVVLALVLALAQPALAPSAEKADVVPVKGDLATLDGIEIPVMMNFERLELSKILESFGAAAGFDVEIDEAIRSKIVTVHLPEVDAKTALLRLAQQNGLEYEVVSPKKLIVRPRASKPDVSN